LRKIQYVQLWYTSTKGVKISATMVMTLRV